MEIKDRLRKLRDDKKISVTQLAAFLGKGESAVRMWEIGRSKPDADTLIKLAKYFDCSTDYLLGLDEYPTKMEREGTKDQLNALSDYLEGLPFKDKKELQTIYQGFANIYKLLDKHQPIRIRYLKTLNAIAFNIEKTVSDFTIFNSIDDQTRNTVLLSALSSEKECNSKIERLYRLFEGAIKGYKIVNVESGTTLKFEDSTIQLNDDSVVR